MAGAVLHVVVFNNIDFTCRKMTALQSYWFLTGINRWSLVRTTPPIVSLGL
jgi:hypothetical protein